uniref:Uncharacterized protein n=1 Tax=Tanacetum cinerariifolium TaxID=118510 RepID=A0A6L2LDG2_TANCI|nr:hypothetical protein [Tanacetum cinerariifolium]
MSTSNQQTLVESGASDRPLILEKGSYVPWASRFKRFLDNKQEDREHMWHSIEVGPPSYSHKLKSYYVTHPSSFINYKEDYQGELQKDAQEDKLIIAMMLLARAITQKFSTPTNNRLCASSNIRIREQMLLGMKDEAGGTLNTEENDFMLDHAYGNYTLEELTAAMIMMACNQPTNDKVILRQNMMLSLSVRVKRALFTSPVATKSRNLGATSVVAKSSGCSKHMASNLSLLRNFIEKILGTFHFGNDHFTVITRYGDFVQGNLTIYHVYYVEGLENNLFLVRQFCDGDLERQRLSHLNFDAINQLTKKDLVDGLPKVKYDKDHLCSTCEQGKSKKATFPPKLVPKELVADEPSTSNSNENTDELIQEDLAAFDINNFYNPFHTSMFEEAESSSTF